LYKPVKNVPALSPLGYDPVGPQNPKILRHTRVGDIQDFLQRVDIQFAATEFLDDSDALGMGENSQQFGQFSGCNSALRHM
jgi:hypothetical protein